MWSPIHARALLAFLIISCGEYRDTPQERGGNDQSFKDVIGGSLLSSPTEEKLRRDHALALTLASTLEQLEGVERARVHLNLADRSLASRNRDAESQAAVLIVQGRGSPPEKEEIKRLTVAAVPGLEKEQCPQNRITGGEWSPQRRTVFPRPFQRLRPTIVLSRVRYDG